MSTLMHLAAALWLVGAVVIVAYGGLMLAGFHKPGPPPRWSAIIFAVAIICALIAALLKIMESAFA